METIVITALQAKQILEKDGKITMAGIEKLLQIPAEKKKLKTIKVNKNLSEMKLLLRLAGFDYVEEYRFHDKRKFRFDMVVLPLEQKLAVEYDGLYSEKSRHTTVTGFSRDQEKMNLALSMGWKVLRYSPLNFTQVVEDVNKITQNL